MEKAERRKTSNIIPHSAAIPLKVRESRLGGATSQTTAGRRRLSAHAPLTQTEP